MISFYVHILAMISGLLMWKAKYLDLIPFSNGSELISAMESARDRHKACEV